MTNTIQCPIAKDVLFTQGKGKAFANPIKRGMKENILEWMQVGFNAGAWCVVKRMLQEEGYFLFAGAMTIPVSCQD
jgi:hypothetical protein